MGSQKKRWLHPDVRKVIIGLDILGHARNDIISRFGIAIYDYNNSLTSVAARDRDGCQASATAYLEGTLELPETPFLDRPPPRPDTPGAKTKSPRVARPKPAAHSIVTPGPDSEVVNSPLHRFFAHTHKAALEMFEREYLRAQLVHHGGNVSQASASAGMSRGSLYRKLKSLRISKDPPSPLPQQAPPASLQIPERKPNAAKFYPATPFVAIPLAVLNENRFARKGHTLPEPLTPAQAWQQMIEVESRIHAAYLNTPDNERHMHPLYRRYAIRKITPASLAGMTKDQREDYLLTAGQEKMGPKHNREHFIVVNFDQPAVIGMAWLDDTSAQPGMALDPLLTNRPKPASLCRQFTSISAGNTYLPIVSDTALHMESSAPSKTGVTVIWKKAESGQNDRPVSSPDDNEFSLDTWVRRTTRPPASSPE